MNGSSLEVADDVLSLEKSRDSGFGYRKKQQKVCQEEEWMPKKGRGGNLADL